MKVTSIKTQMMGRAVFGAALCIAATAPAVADTVRIGGTGMALAAMQSAGEGLAATQPDISTKVLPSLGTPGGLKALGQGAIDLAVIGRPLTADEKAKELVDAGCTTTALLFATSHPRPHGITTAQLPGIYADERPSWPDGGPLKIILRSRAGSENAYLTAAIPGMAAALDTAYQRRGIPVATTDQENAEQASRIAGSFAIMTMLQMRAEKLELRPVALDGVLPSAETVADKTYPLSVSVCLVLPARPKPAAEKFVAYLKSGAGRALLTSLGAAPLR
jgi:phosphate transport system substrate-binding protein